MIIPALIALLLLILIVILAMGPPWSKGRSRLRVHGRRAVLIAQVVRGGRKPAWVIGQLVRLKALMPEAGCRSLADVFNRRFMGTRGVSVSKSFVAYTLRARRHEIEQARRDIRGRRATTGPRNRVWGWTSPARETAGEAPTPSSASSITGPGGCWP